MKKKEKRITRVIPRCGYDGSHAWMIDESTTRVHLMVRSGNVHLWRREKVLEGGTTLFQRQVDKLSILLHCKAPHNIGVLIAHDEDLNLLLGQVVKLP